MASENTSDTQDAILKVKLSYLISAFLLSLSVKGSLLYTVYGFALRDYMSA